MLQQRQLLFLAGIIAAQPPVWKKGMWCRNSPSQGLPKRRAYFDSGCRRSCGRLVKIHLPLLERPTDPHTPARTTARLPDVHIWNQAPGSGGQPGSDSNNNHLPSTRGRKIESLCHWHEGAQFGLQAYLSLWSPWLARGLAESGKWKGECP